MAQDQTASSTKSLHTCQPTYTPPPPHPSQPSLPRSVRANVSNFTTNRVSALLSIFFFRSTHYSFIARYCTFTLLRGHSQSSSSSYPPSTITMAWMLSLKALLVLTSVVFVGLALKLSAIGVGILCLSRASLMGLASLLAQAPISLPRHQRDHHWHRCLFAARLKNLVDKDAEEKSDAATEALLQELVVDAEETKKEATGTVDEQHPLPEEDVEQALIGLLGSTDELNQQEEELRAEFEEVERKLEETLELQRRMENDAKQKRLAEQNDNVED
ncbi:hypothetical protein CJ030_MR2G027128 [Morella rubra]|uniref:Uncharacterized protein n=1 Tax=Morella rubra TaxID=262757 RepID=A0A6A1W8B4_9ROSI|nr:hypothetical protein CJ030_MR2G027128 [Morella rubra]